MEWRNRIKKRFEEREGRRSLYTDLHRSGDQGNQANSPASMSVDGYNILYKKDINIGMAAALPSGNLIVPVIKNADRMNLAGLTATVNDPLAGPDKTS